MNRLVFEDRQLASRWYTRVEAEQMLAAGTLRKLPERSGSMRIVEIERVELNACGGTHVSSTGAIGSLVLRRVEKVKQGWRVEFVCGMRAVRLARRDLSALTEVASRLSVGGSEVPKRVEALQTEAKAMSKANGVLLQEIAELHAAELKRSAKPGSVVTATFAGKPMDFAKRVASELGRTGHSAVVGATEAEQGHVAVAVSKGDDRHAGQFLREALASLGVRGGGSAELAQTTFAAQQMREVISALVSAFTKPRGTA